MTEDAIENRAKFLYNDDTEEQIPVSKNITKGSFLCVMRKMPKNATGGTVTATRWPACEWAGVEPQQALVTATEHAHFCGEDGASSRNAPVMTPQFPSYS